MRKYYFLTAFLVLSGAMALAQTRILFNGIPLPFNSSLHGMLSTDQFVDQGLGTKQLRGISSDAVTLGLERGCKRYYLNAGGSLFITRESMSRYVRSKENNALGTRMQTDNHFSGAYYLMYTKMGLRQTGMSKTGSLGYSIRLKRYILGPVKGYALHNDRVTKYDAEIITPFNIEAGLAASYLVRTGGNRYSFAIEFQARLLLELPQLYQVVHTELKSNAPPTVQYRVLEPSALNLSAGIYLWNIITLVAPKS